MTIKRSYFAYRHINGHIKVKRYCQLSYDDAFESDFVEDVTDVYKAESRSEAEKIGKEKLDAMLTI